MESLGRYIGSGLCTLGLGGSGIGSGIVLGSVIYGIQRNPILESKLFNLGMVFFALIESLALFSLIIAIIILYG
jgi:F0F1-type ATP synthase membrane subunit c/vacuolar-type H+-ATPase subunit K